MASLELSRTVPAIDGDPLSYWWKVCRGADAMRAFHATPEAEAWNVVYQHPVLLLPELVEAAERLLGATRETAGLRQMHHALRGSEHFAPFYRMLAMTLAGERTGSERANLERALAVIDEVRRANAAEPADDELEAAIRARLDGLTPPSQWAEGTVDVAPDPTWGRLFLDDTELPAFTRREDRRTAGPNPKDRNFVTHGGLLAGSCEWVGDETSAVFRIVESRWLFPSTKAAKTYLDSLKISGMESDALPTIPPLPIADGAYAWGGVVPGRVPVTRRQIVVFRVARVVAKLHVTEGPKAASVFQVLAPSMLQPYAELVVRRVKWALAQYWLAVQNGTAAARAFVETPPRALEREPLKVFSAHPILMLPAFPTAMATLGDIERIAADRLVELQRKVKSNNWSGYRDAMRALVRALLDEQGGELTVNADAALNLVIDHRRVDSDYSWAALEEEARART